MGKASPVLLPRLMRNLADFGLKLKMARLRRKFTAESVAQRAGITRSTLVKIEKGDPSVALGSFARVMQVLRLEDDLLKLATDDVLGRKLQDAELLPGRRAPKRTKKLAETKSVDEGQPDGTL